jgi:hypothetical protein
VQLALVSLAIVEVVQLVPVEVVTVYEVGIEPPSA